MQKLLAHTLLIATTTLFSAGVQAELATVTQYPVIVAHGTLGWDSLGGYSYFGNDYGVFVGDSCAYMDANNYGCNAWIAGNQEPKTTAFQVTSLNNSEVRGNELYNHIRNFMASTGHAKVNLVGHSQGGMDSRKAAAQLKAYYGTARVGAMISISSPHRGTPYAKRLVDLYARNADDVFCGALPPNPDGTDPCLAAAAAIADNVFDYATGASTAGNDAIAALTQFIYNDYDPNDGKVTGAKAFNTNYPGVGVADYVASIVTAQDDGNENSLLQGLHSLLSMNGDGNGYCVDDCDNDGAAGQGNGVIRDMDDDGMVGINSQQFGYRLKYTANDFTCAWYGCWDPLDKIEQLSSTGYVANINAPSSTQMTSNEGVLPQDHLDVISLGPDDLDENEFYASIFNFIASKGF